MKPKAKDEVGDYVRITLSIPKELWPWFETQRKLPQHSGNRSSLVRSLILEKMDSLRTRKITTKKLTAKRR